MARGRQKAVRWWLAGLWMFSLVAALAAVPVDAQFGLGIKQEWTDFADPAGRFALRVPPGWTYQADVSNDAFFVFYGTGEHDLFYVEILEPAGVEPAPAAQAQDAIRRYAGPGGLPGFRLVNPPAAGTLADRDATYIVYSYRDSAGIPIVEGRAFVLHGGKVVTLAFADAEALFDASVPTFNAVLESFRLMEPSGAPKVGAGFGLGTSARPQQPQQPQQPPAAQTAPVEPAAGAARPSYTGPGGYYRFTPPEGWELWEEQWTGRGDTIDPWNGVFNWSGKPMAKALFIWDYFDEWEQKGAQYDIVLGVIENVPGTLAEGLETLKDQVMGDAGGVYTVATQRVRIGSETGVAAQIVVRPGMVEPWTTVSPWYKTVTFYAFKPGNTLFVWVVPNEVAEHEAVAQAMQSFQWMGR